MLPRIFIASSVESLEWAHAVQEGLDFVSEPVCWDQAFTLSTDVLSQLADVLGESDFGVFLFAPDDIARIRNHKFRVVRDNVLFEMGMCIAALGRRRTFVLLPRNVADFHLPSDLASLIPATFDTSRPNLRAALGSACAKIVREIKTQGQKRGAQCEVMAHHEVNWGALVDAAEKEIRACGFALVNLADVNSKKVIDKIQSSTTFRASFVVGDPSSPTTTMRIADEQDNIYTAHDIAKIALRLMKERDDRLKPARKDKRLSVRLSQSYPTLAVSVIDDDLYAYSYPFGQLGTQGPVFRFRNCHANPLAKTYVDHLAGVERASVEPKRDRLEAFLGLSRRRRPARRS